MKPLVFVLFVVLLVTAACTPASRKTPGAPGAPGSTNSGSSGQNVSAGPGNAAQGSTLFTSSCSSCHGPGAKGLPGLGKDLTTSAFVASQSDEELLAFIKRGRPAGDPANTTGVDMPPKGGNPALNDANLNDIISFIRSIHQ